MGVFFPLCLLYAGCTIGSWAFLNRSYVFLDTQIIIQGNSAWYCSSPSKLRSPASATKAGKMLIKIPSAASPTLCRVETAHGGVSLLRSQGVQLGPCVLLGVVCGHVNISCPCPWCGAIQAVLPQRLAGLWWLGMLTRWYHCTRQVWGVMRLSFCGDSALPCRSMALFHEFGAFISPKIKAEKYKGLWKWRAKGEENIPVGFRGNCPAPLSIWQKSALHLGFQKKWSWFFGLIQLLPLPIHMWMCLTLQKGIQRPMEQSPQAWENGCKTTRISNTKANCTHTPHRSYTHTSKQDEWKK